MDDSRSSRHVKLLVTFENSHGAEEVESIWALPEARGYRLDNMPFCARGLAVEDVVSALADPDGALRFTGVVAASGHSTIRLWFANAGDVQKIRDELRAMGCGSELDMKRLVAVDVPPHVPYAPVRDYLERQERSGLLEYEEGCLGQGQKPSA